VLPVFLESVCIAWRLQRSVGGQEPPSVAGCFGSAAAAAVAAAHLPSAVVAWLPVAGADPPFVVAGELLLPAGPPGNGAPQRLHEGPRFRAALWAFRLS